MTIGVKLLLSLFIAFFPVIFLAQLFLSYEQKLLAVNIMGVAICLTAIYIIWFDIK
jgi:hypothetical protein